MKRSALMLWLPLGLFILLGSIFVIGLRRPEDRTIGSKLIGTPLPAFTLAPATPDVRGLASTDLAQGRPVLVNIFASWCVPCAAEAPQLAALRARGTAIVGIAIRDRPDDLASFLKRNGNPFEAIGADPDSHVQIALGSSGVPESFVVDGKGVIRFQKIGPIRTEDLPSIGAVMAAAR